MATLMQDHPGWQETSGGTWVRVMRRSTERWLLTWHAGDEVVSTTSAGGGNGLPPVVDRIEPVVPVGALAVLTPAVEETGPVLRARNGDLWDAIGTAIIRQVIRAGQARIMYDRFCGAHGEAVATPYGVRHLFPSPEVVVALPVEAFAELGMAFKRRPLAAAAEAYIGNAEKWEQLDPLTVVKALQSVPRIGPWTAGAAIADVSGDFSLYPYADLAVRTWAHRAAPGVVWPEDEASFGALWRRDAGSHLSALTLLTLAWGGTHVRTP